MRFHVPTPLVCLMGFSLLVSCATHRSIIPISWSREVCSKPEWSYVPHEQGAYTLTATPEGLEIRHHGPPAADGMLVLLSADWWVGCSADGADVELVFSMNPPTKRLTVAENQTVPISALRPPSSDDVVRWVPERLYISECTPGSPRFCPSMEKYCLVASPRGGHGRMIDGHPVRASCR